MDPFSLLFVLLGLGLAAAGGGGGGGGGDGGGGDDDASEAPPAASNELEPPVISTELLETAIFDDFDGTGAQPDDGNVIGTNGSDLIFGGLQADGADTKIDSGVEDDTIVGDAGDDTILAGPGADFVLGGAQNDLLFGNEGIDTILGGDGDDSIAGGDEDPGTFAADLKAFIELASNNEPMLRNANEGEISDGLQDLLGDLGEEGQFLLRAGLVPALSGVLFETDELERLEGGMGDDEIVTGTGNHLIVPDFGFFKEGDIGAEAEGPEGPEAEQSLIGDDTVIGNAGVDVVVYRGGMDSLDGGAGDMDILALGGEDGTDYAVDLGAGTLTGAQAASGFEHVLGSFSDDTLTGDGQDNLLAGGFGTNVLIGGGGDDTLSSGFDFEGPRVVVRMEVHDGELSNFDADTADSLTGGAGEDLFLVDGNTHVTDFNPAEDVIDLSDLYPGLFFAQDDLDGGVLLTHGIKLTLSDGSPVTAGMLTTANTNLLANFNV